MMVDSNLAALGVEHSLSRDEVQAFLRNVQRRFAETPFRPQRFLTNSHAQTLAAYAWPRRIRWQRPADEARLFQVASDTQVLAQCRWQRDRRAHATVILWHGIEGSSDAVYMRSTAQKAFASGFNVVRMNLRNCGDTEHLTPTLYHGGLSEDLRSVVEELIQHDRLERLLLIGFSLGGNMVLKLAGEYGDQLPAAVRGVCAVSPSVDLGASANLIMQKSNWLYHRDFLRRLKRRLRAKHKLFPDHYDISELPAIQTIREFDDRYTSRAHGFDGAADYYNRGSALRVIEKIKVPTLIIHGQDDPFIPYAPLTDAAVTNNPYILLLAPERGGHVAFVTPRSNGEDRFWAENRVVEFCRLADEDCSQEQTAGEGNN